MLLLCIYIPNSLVSHKSFVLHLPGFCSPGFLLGLFSWNKSYPLTYNGMGHVPMHRQKCFSQICLDTPLQGHFELCDSGLLTAQSSTQMQNCWFSQQVLPLHSAGRSMVREKKRELLWVPWEHRVLSRGGWSCKERIMPSSCIWGQSLLMECWPPQHWVRLNCRTCWVRCSLFRKPGKQDFSGSRISPLPLKRHWYSCYNLFLPENKAVWTLSYLKIKFWKNSPPA